MDYAQLNDENLARLASEDIGAADVLLARYKNFVKTVVRPYFIAGADREDLVQEGMIGLYKAIREYRGGSDTNFPSFAAICIKNHILTAVKKASRKKHIPLNTYVSIDGDNPEVLHIIDKDSDANPERALLQQESRQGLEGIAATSLSPLESAVLTCFLAGLSYTEIADKLGIAAKTVDNALSRIRRKTKAKAT